MATPFLSSEEYDERAHQLYNEGQYDEALEVLRQGLGIYPTSVELHIGVGYARVAREEFSRSRVLLVRWNPECARQVELPRETLECDRTSWGRRGAAGAVRLSNRCA